MFRLVPLHHRAIDLKRKRNVDAWEDTVKQVHFGLVDEPDGSIKVDCQILTITPQIKPNYSRPTRVRVVNADTLDVMREALTVGLKPVGLNMANPIRPGGGVITGAGAQEECLFRRSNYFQTLLHTLYPIEDNQVVYSPSITVIKDHRYRNCAHWRCSMIAAAALERTPMDPDNYDELERELMRQKIKIIFHTALLHGHDCLVLGALGCGAFHNPPFEVASLFRDVICQYEGCFREIIFAVLNKDYDTTPNYEIFKLLDNTTEVKDP